MRRDWLRRRWLVVAGVVGAVAVTVAALIARGKPPTPAVAVVLVGAVLLGLVGPAGYAAARRVADDDAAVAIVRRVVIVAVSIAVVGVVFAAGAEIGRRAAGGGLVYMKEVYQDGKLAYTVPVGVRQSLSENVVVVSILVAGVLALVGLVLGPWVFLVVRTFARALARERAARARAEERATVAAHLHDSVLQTLTLIQQQAGDAGGVIRLARHTERDLRAWLYGTNGAGDPDGAGRGEDADDDIAAALGRAVAEVEDRFGVAVELVTVGTCPLDESAAAVVGAAREAVINAARHALVRRISVFAEVADGQVLVLVRDRGRGFDQAVEVGPDRRGIADSIVGRLRRHGGSALITSAVGEGTEVELRMPAGAAP